MHTRSIRPHSPYEIAWRACVIGWLKFVHFVTGGPRQLVIAATVLVALVIPFVLKSFLLPNRRNRAKPKPKNAIQRATSFVPIAM